MQQPLDLQKSRHICVKRLKPLYLSKSRSETDIVLDTHMRKERKILIDKAKSPLLWKLSGYLYTIEAYLSLYLLQTCDRFEQKGLATACAAEDHKVTLLWHLQRELA